MFWLSSRERKGKPKEMKKVILFNFFVYLSMFLGNFPSVCSYVIFFPVVCLYVHLIAFEFILLRGTLQYKKFWRLKAHIHKQPRFKVSAM